MDSLHTHNWYSTTAMINSVSHFNNIQRCFGEGRNRTEHYILLKLGQTFKEACNSFVPAEVPALRCSSTISQSNCKGARWARSSILCSGGCKLCHHTRPIYRAVVHLFIVIHQYYGYCYLNTISSHIHSSLLKQKFTSCNFWANKDVTHLHCRNSLFGKAALAWRRLGTSLPRTWRRSATSPWSSSRPSTTRWAWNWRGTAWRGCGDEVPSVASPLRSPSCPAALKGGA